MIYGEALREFTLSNLKYRNITGRKIRYYRLKKSMGQERLSQKLESFGLDTAVHMVEHIETGKRVVSDIDIYFIAKALDVAIEMLFDPKNEFPLYTKDVYDESTILQEITTFDGRKNVTGKQIKEARESMGISQAELERRLQLQGVYIRRLGEIESESRVVTDMELYYLAKVLHKSIMSLYDINI